MTAPTIISLIHYGTIATITAATGLAVGVSQGLTANVTLAAIDRQPASKGELTRSNLLSLALIETAALLSLIFAMLLFFKAPANYYAAVAEIGIGLALTIPGVMIGIASSMPAREAMIAIARQPFLSKKITNFMVLAQSLIQTPLIFGFIISLLIKSQLDSIDSMPDALRLIASGLCIAVASIGPAWGAGYFTHIACRSIGMNRAAYGKIFSFTIISQAIIETPVIFASIVSFWLAQSSAAGLNVIQASMYLAIAGVMAIGTFGAGLSSGKTAAAACNQIALNPQNYGILSRTSLIAQGLIDTSAIYAFIIAFIILLARF